jgi:hypothetical protein
MGRAGTRRRAKAGIVAAGVVVLAFYVWLGTAPDAPIRFRHHPPTDRYNQLADAFQDGSLSLRQRPAPDLLALRDPYDPTANAAIRGRDALQDLTLYDKRFYIYWGPAPVVTLFLPARWLGVHDLPDNLAMIIFAFLAWVGAAGVLYVVGTRILPRGAPWMLVLGALALGFMNLGPWLLSRSSTYEIAIGAGQAFLMLGLWALAVAITRQQASRALLALGSTGIGLALASRANLGLAAVVLVALGVWLARREPSRRVGDLLALGAPFAICAAAMAAYNAARFGSPLEIGHKYMISDATLRPHELAQFANVPVGLFIYLFGRVALRPEFPFFTINFPADVPWGLPSRITFRDGCGGLLAKAPLVLMLAGLPFLRRRPTVPNLGLAVIAGLAALGVGELLLVSFYINGVSERYSADFVGLLLVAALLTWTALAAVVARQAMRRWIQAAGAALAVFGAVLGAAVAVQGHGLIEATRPRFYHDLADAFDWFRPVARTLAWESLGRELLSLAVLLAALFVAALLLTRDSRAAAGDPGGRRG